MPNEQELRQISVDDQTAVWLVFINDQQTGAAFWEQADAAAHAALLGTLSPVQSVVLRAVTVQGSRPRCQLCGEPVVLDDPSDLMSWIHAADANDLGDHTAEV